MQVTLILLTALVIRSLLALGQAPETGQAASAQPGQPAGGISFRLPNISLDMLMAAGTSTETDERLQTLQAGGHDPRKRGFTIQNVELSFMAAVDPYFNGEAHLVYFIDPVSGESVTEIEEAFLTTQALPLGLQVKAGQFFTEFGRVNPQHPHQWHWQDQPVINARLFGPDGMRGPGVRVGWLTPLPWFSELYLGVQNANGETMASFLANEEFFAERPVGGRPFVGREVKSLGDLVRLGRWDNFWELGDEASAKVGLCCLSGPNATGPEGRTRITGADAVLKWRRAANQRGWPFLVFESEVIRRDYRADRFFSPGPDPTFGAGDGLLLPGTTLRDWGFYAHLLWGFRVNWAAGIRVDYAGGLGNGVAVDFEAGLVGVVDRNADPFRADRLRISPVLAWHPTEFSRFRLQYNYDRLKAFDRRSAHSIWLGAEIMIGAHAAHKY
jgi:hypothetical protein